MQHAIDMAAKASPNDGCSANRYTTFQAIDHVYVTPKDDISASKFVKMKQDGVINEASDHSPAYAVFRLPNEGGLGSVKIGDDYARECADMQRSGAPGLACDGQCVDFVKFRLKKYINKQDFASLGNGNQAVSTLGGKGYKVNSTPAVNSVVSWPAGGVSGPAGGANASYGHTAMVSGVNPDGSIVVEEYNVISLSYSKRTIPAETARKLTYAHTEVDFK